MSAREAVRRWIVFSVLVAALLLLGAPRPAHAEELCPGCYGSGKVGCGGCTSSGMGAFIGRCSGCQGFFGGMSLKPGEKCGRCRGSGVCQSCDGKGAACIVCKGSGRVPNGTAKGLAELRAKEQKEGLAKRLGRLKYLVGRWKGKGEDREKGAYTSEMRWTTALEDSFLRHEERVEYASGSRLEVVSYLTWQEGRGQYRWIVAVQPGRILEFSGTPSADGDSIEWQFPTRQGGLSRITWLVNPDKKLFDGRDEAFEEGAWKRTGGVKFQQTTAEPGDALVESKGAPAEGDEATNAVNEGLKPLRLLVGWWKGEGEGPDGKLSGESTSRARLGGTVLERDGAFKAADGTVNRERWLLTWDPEQSRYILCAFLTQGRILLFFGARNEAGDEVTFDLDGPRLVWKLDPKKGRIEWHLDLKNEDGTFKVLEKGVDTRTEKGE